ncbi:general substrate transporter [Podospora fimiseda]|uniref:General substrate transporter n=1 Tax=Podospora fimiseda TaxID=252190 RepID=A0AAN7BL40_9PEZI|nr:general substrate transporter [Podospora fimiseda]
MSPHLPQASLYSNRKCLLICALISLANLQYGLDTITLSNLQAMPGFLLVFGYSSPSLPSGYGIDRTFQQLIASLLTLGAFLSSLFSGIFAHYFGRRQALWLACLLTVIGAVIQIVTTSHGVVYLGRLIIGIGNGFLVTFSNIYCAEASPAHLRAVMVALFSEWAVIGSVLAGVICYAMSEDLTKRSYQVPLGTQFIVPVFLAGILFFVPESPRWLVNKGRLEEGKKALKVLRGDSLTDEELELEWMEIVKGIEEEKKLAAGGVGWLDMFRGNNLRRTLLCFSVMASQSGSGCWFLFSYSTYFLVVSGLNVDEAFRFSILKTCIGFVGVQVGIYLMRHVLGRRMTLMMGALTQGLSMLGMAVVATVVRPKTVLSRDLLVTFVCLFYFAYDAFVGAASYPVATEVVSTRLRSYTVGSAISLGYLLAWVTGFASPFFINPESLNWGAKYAYIWTGTNLLCGIVFFFFFPETKGRTLEEIDELFERRIPAWKFKSTKTNIMDEALREVREKSTVEIVKKV